MLAHLSGTICLKHSATLILPPLSKPPSRRTCLITISKLFFTALPIPSSDILCACVRACVCVCVCVVSVIVKRPVLPPSVVDGRSRNPLYYYCSIHHCPIHHCPIQYHPVQWCPVFINILFIIVPFSTTLFNGVLCSLISFHLRAHNQHDDYSGASDWGVRCSTGLASSLKKKKKKKKQDGGGSTISSFLV